MIMHMFPLSAKVTVTVRSVHQATDTGALFTFHCLFGKMLALKNKTDL